MADGVKYPSSSSHAIQWVYTKLKVMNSVKRANARRISGAITSATIDELFTRLGAKPAALAVSKPMWHEIALPQGYEKRDRKYLLSVLYVLEVIADR
ncbi:hypothetical protein KEM54_001380 [Ascosphaera aggregata]|nr:hypothetical protein KEM54_001380 [Ascosphaera aggregata]